MRAKRIIEAFTEESDPVKDMGIGMTPLETLNLFCEEFHKEFGIFAYPDQAGQDYTDEDELEGIDIYRIGKTSFVNHITHPVVKLISGEYFELLLAMNDKGANAIKSGTKWGWFYYNRGTPIYLKGVYELKEIFQRILKIRSIDDKRLDKIIAMHKHNLDGAKKLKEIYNEG